MALPGFQQTNLDDPNSSTDRQVVTGNDVISYAPPAAVGVSAATATKPAFDVTSVLGPVPLSPFAKPAGNFGESLYEKAAKSLQAPDSDPFASLNPQEANMKALKSAQNNPDLIRFNESYDMSKKYADAAQQAYTMHHETRTNADAANFLSNFAHVDHHDPQYIQKVTDLLAADPYAGAHGAVQSALAIAHQNRQGQMAAEANGGINQFEPNSPGAITYANIYKATGGDAGAATAAAHTAEAGHKEMVAHIQSGALTPEDFPTWNPQSGTPRPAEYGPHGTFNYHMLNEKGAARLGASASKIARADNAETRVLREQVGMYQKQLDSLDPADPNYAQVKAVHDDAFNRMLAMDRQRVAAPLSGGASAPAPVATPKSPSSYFVKKP